MVQSLKAENIDLHSQAFTGLLEQLFIFTRPANRADRASASLSLKIT